MRDLSRRDQRLLASAGHDQGGNVEDQHHRVPAARLRLCRERRLVYQLGQMVAVETDRATSRWRCATRSGHRGADFPQDAANLALVLNDLEHRSNLRAGLVEHLREADESIEGFSTKVLGGTIQLFLH